MKHPYFCKSDGYTYEKKKLMRHLKKNGLVSPMTGEVILKDFIRNNALEQAILYWQSHSNNYVPGLKGKRGKKKRSKSFTQKMINEWEKSQKTHIEKDMDNKRKQSKERLKTRLGRRDQKVTPIEKAKNYFDAEKQAI